VPNASLNIKRIIRVFRSSIEIRVLRCNTMWFIRVTTIGEGSNDAIITHTKRDMEREREKEMVTKEGADGWGGGHILSYIEWYHIIGMGTKLRFIET
jgi:hypothetical protein